MKQVFSLFFLITIVASAGIFFYVVKSPQTETVHAQGAIPAFPGAEGFGAMALNDCDRSDIKVIKVTNLNNSGPESFRDAIENQLRPGLLDVIVFRTGGTIIIDKAIDIVTSCVYLAGQTAPGGGITLKNGLGNTDTPLSIETNDVVIRYIRSRPGPAGLSQQEAADKYKELEALRAQIESEGKSVFDERQRLYDIGAGCCLGAIGVSSSQVLGESYNVIIDHSSMSWGFDTSFDVFQQVHNVTTQWSTITETLNKSLHFKGAHGYGLLIGGKGTTDISFHHNLIAHHTARNPRISAGLIDVVNNVFYDPSGTPGVFSESDGNLEVNYIGNYVKWRPGSDTDRCLVAVLDRNDKHDIVGVHTSNNFLDGDLTGNTACPDVNDVPEGAIRQGDRGYWVGIRFDAPQVITTSPQIARDQVLAYAGANARLDCQGNWILNRDAVDTRATNEIRNGTGRVIDHPDEVGGWPTLAAGTSCTDSDNDGMPNAWEQRYFNSLTAAVINEDSDNDGYTNIEEYLNGTDPGSSEPPPPGRPSPSPSIFPIIFQNPLTMGQFKEFFDSIINWLVVVGGGLIVLMIMIAAAQRMFAFSPVALAGVRKILIYSVLLYAGVLLIKVILGIIGALF